MPDTTGQSTAGVNAPSIAETGNTVIEIYNDGALTAGYSLADIQAQLVAQGAATSQGTPLTAGAFSVTSIDVTLKPLNGDVQDVISGTKQSATTADAVVTSNGGKRDLDPSGGRADFNASADFLVEPVAGSALILDVSYAL